MTNEIKNLFGKWVVSDTILIKGYEEIEKKTYLKWFEEKLNVTGIFIGTRTVWEGHVYKIYYNTDFGVESDGHAQFDHTNHFEVGLIVPHWRVKPIYVALNRVKQLCTSGDIQIVFTVK